MIYAMYKDFLDVIVVDTESKRQKVKKIPVRTLKDRINNGEQIKGWCNRVWDPCFFDVDPTYFDDDVLYKYVRITEKLSNFLVKYGFTESVFEGTRCVWYNTTTKSLLGKIRVILFNDASIGVIGDYRYDIYERYGFTIRPICCLRYDKDVPLSYRNRVNSSGSCFSDLDIIHSEKQFFQKLRVYLEFLQKVL